MVYVIILSGKKKLFTLTSYNSCILTSIMKREKTNFMNRNPWAYKTFLDPMQILFNCTWSWKCPQHDHNMQACGPTVGTSNSTKHLCPLDWLHDCVIELAIANHRDFHLKFHNWSWVACGSESSYYPSMDDHIALLVILEIQPMDSICVLSTNYNLIVTYVFFLIYVLNYKPWHCPLKHQTRCLIYKQRLRKAHIACIGNVWLPITPLLPTMIPRIT